MHDRDPTSASGHEGPGAGPGETRRSRVRVSLERHSALPILVAVAVGIALLASLSPDSPGPESGASGSQTGDASEPSPEAVVRSLDGLRGQSLEHVWDRVHQLEASLRDREDVLDTELVGKRRLFELSDEGQLAAAALLLELRREREPRDAAQTVLLALAHEGRSLPLRVAAIRLLGREGGIERSYPALDRLLKSLLDGRPRGTESSTEWIQLVVASWRALWELDNETSPQPLLALLKDGTPQLRNASAIALAEARHFDREVVEVLRELRNEPSERGDRVRLLYRLTARRNGGPSYSEAGSLRPRSEPGGSTAPPRRPESGDPPRGDGVLDDVVRTLEGTFVEPDRVDRKAIYEESLRAALGTLPYTRFLGPSDLERLEFNSLGQYLGLGAQMVKLDRDADLVVVRPHYEVSAGGVPVPNPLRTGDRIVAVDGVPCRGQSAEEIRKLLSHKADGDPTYLKVRRWGWTEPRLVEVRYGTLNVPTLQADFLPEGIGYVKLHRTTTEAAEELEALLTRWTEEERLETLILDLRDNPGGKLQAAVRIAGLFTEDDGRPIVSEVRADGTRRAEYAATETLLVSQPVVVLVNRWTASAAEVVAGALQDLSRATIVGHRTYGKGVSQERLPAPPKVEEVLGGPAHLQIATHYLELPSGRRFHGERDRDGRPMPGREGGIVPDIEVDPIEESFEGWQIEELRKVQFSEELHDYLKRHMQDIRLLWAEGAELWDPDQQPGARFQAFYDLLQSRLQTRLSRRDVRVALRNVLRHHLEDEREEEFVYDLRGDSQLQEAVRVLLDGMGLRGEALASHPRYGWLARKISAEE